MRRFLAVVALAGFAAGLLAPPLSLARPSAGGAAFRSGAPLAPRLEAPSRRSRVVVSLGEESGLPDPSIAVAVFAFLFAAFAYTQFDMVQVVNQEDLDGAEGSRRARDALARKRGYFRK